MKISRVYARVINIKLSVERGLTKMEVTGKLTASKQASKLINCVLFVDQIDNKIESKGIFCPLLYG